MRRIGELFSARRTPAPYPFPPSWQPVAATVTGVIIAMAIIMGIAVAVIKIGGGGNLLLFFSLLFFVFLSSFSATLLSCFFFRPRNPSPFFGLSSSRARPLHAHRGVSPTGSKSSRTTIAPFHRHRARATRRFCECFHPICGL